MAHKRRNGKLRWRNKKACHGRKGGVGGEKSDFRRDFWRQDKKYLKAHT